VALTAKLSRIERFVAVGLALVWLGAGGAALWVAARQGDWPIGAVALLALAYGGAWLRVALRSHRLSWQELVAPWRAVR
jgi:hypothetical protein